MSLPPNFLDIHFREKALITLFKIGATNRMRELIPLLDDTTPIEYDRRPPGPEWRICDRAAADIDGFLGWERMGTSFRMFNMGVYVRPDQREKMMNHAREWAKQAQTASQ